MFKDDFVYPKQTCLFTLRIIVILDKTLKGIRGVRLDNQKVFFFCAPGFGPIIFSVFFMSFNSSIYYELYFYKLYIRFLHLHRKEIISLHLV